MSMLDKPMKGIMLVNEFEHSKSVVFRAANDCGENECDTTIDIEFDEKYGMEIITFWKKVGVFAFWYSDYDDPIWRRIRGNIKVIWKRIKIASRVLFTGYYEAQEEFLIHDPEAIGNIIKALEYGKEKTAEWEADWKSKLKSKEDQK
jgi:hypothetical protein